MFGKIATFFLAMTFIPVLAMAGEKNAQRMEKTLAKYEKTGKVLKCLMVTRIHSTIVIDDYNVFFDMKGKKGYLNTLPHRCSRLGFERSFSYQLYSSNLCDLDIITVFDSSSHIQGPSCGLGKFVEYVKKSDDKSDEKSEENPQEENPQEEKK